jgi:hypothetical protein
VSYFKEALGATNVPGYTLLSGGCVQQGTSRVVDSSVFCAGDLAAKSAFDATKEAPLYVKQGPLGLCFNRVTNKPVDAKYCVKEPSTWDKISGGFLDAAKLRSSGGGTSGGMPSWILPVGLGVVAIGAVLLLTKKKSSPAAAPAATPAATPASNPGRRRRRR